MPDSQTDNVSPGEVLRLLARIDKGLTEHRTETRRDVERLHNRLDALANVSAAHGEALSTHHLAIAKINDDKSSDTLKQLIEIARDVQGVTKFGKLLWGVLIASTPVLAGWWLWLKFKAAQ